MRVVVIDQGQVRVEDPPVVTVDRMQTYVGGPFQLVRRYPLADGFVDLFVNEEGFPRGLPLNVIVPHLHTAYGAIQGPVLLCGCDDDGTTVGLTSRQLAAIQLVHPTGCPYPTLLIDGR